MSKSPESKSRIRLCNKNYSKRASQDQKIYLVTFLENDLDMKGPENMLLSSKDTKWNELAEILNDSEDGAYKTPAQWRRYWLDTMKHIRKKIKKIDYKDENNMKLENHEVLTDLDTKIINLMRRSKLTQKKSDEEYIPDTDSEDEIEDNDDIELAENEDNEDNKFNFNESVKSEFDKSKSNKRKRDSTQIYCEELNMRNVAPAVSKESKQKKKKTEPHNANEVDTDLLETRLALEKDRIKALNEISSSIRYLADVIRSVMTNTNVKNGSCNKT